MALTVNKTKIKPLPGAIVRPVELAEACSAGDALTIDTNGNFVKDGAVYQLTRAKLQSRAHSSKQWLRLVAVIAGITNGESIYLEAYLVDGTVPYADTGVIS